MRTADVLRTLSHFESRNLTLAEADGSWPIVWDRAKGEHVWDIEGKKFLDLTAGFGVASTGHCNPRVVRAGQRQMARLLHALADIHPHAYRAKLARLLSQMTYERWSASAKSETKTGKVIFCSSGFEAIEAALKSALLVTGKPGIIAFTGAYHGLGYGALNVTQRDYFREPFRKQLREFAQFVDFPTNTDQLECIEAKIREKVHSAEIGAILVEPVQVRGGVNVPPKEFLPRLREICNELDTLLVLDEIYTGLGRTGRWFACEHSGVVPDIICIGKGLAGGFPLSACIGRADVMDAGWPPATGDPLHTSTFLGNPVGCAMAIAQISELKRLRLIPKSASRGRYLLKALSTLSAPAHCAISPRGLGLLAGIELRLADGSPATTLAFSIVKRMLRKGFILLTDGENANVLEFTPPLTITEHQLSGMVNHLNHVLTTDE